MRPRKPSLRIPGEASWQWHVQLKVERALSPLRILIFAVSFLAWMTSAHPPASRPALVVALVVLACAYAAVDAVLLFRRPDLISQRPWGSTVLDALFVAGWLFATGGPQSAFLMLVLLGAVSAPLRNPTRVSLVLAVAYVAIIFVIAGPAHWDAALYVLIAGAGMTLWTAVNYRERRNSLRDDLTGSFSREYANFRLNDIYERSAFPVALAMIDLDGFKDVNDTLGHPAGDAVLVQAVRTIAAAVRQGDLLARSGGDEFTLVLPRTGADAARAIAERIRLGIELTRFRHRREFPPIRLTASIGIAVALDAATDRAHLVAAADERLYAAKQAGRNRVMM